MHLSFHFIKTKNSFALRFYISAELRLFKIVKLFFFEFAIIIAISIHKFYSHFSRNTINI